MMPKAKQKTSGAHEASEDEAMEDATASSSFTGETSRLQVSVSRIDDLVSARSSPSVNSDCTQASRVDKQFAQMSVHERKKVANDIVHYLLITDYKKVLIKQSDIKKYAIKEHSRAFNSLMKMASDKLHEVFGIKVVETEAGKQKAYMLINELENMSDSPHQKWSADDHARTGLLMILLSTILMKGNVLMEDDLYELLRLLGISVDAPDATFGDIKRLLFTDFVRQGYLEIEQEHGTNPPVHLFRWGPRAKAEMTKRNAMDFICQIYGEETPKRWPAQMRDIEETEPEGSLSEGPA